MEVLAPTSISPPPSPYANAPRKPASSLLDRRPSAQKLLAHTEPPHATAAPAAPIISLAASAPGLHATEPSLLAGAPRAASTVLRATRAPSSSLLPFVPLTPIMASPRMTPDLGTGPGAFAAVGAPASASGSARPSSDPSADAAAAQHGDYLTRGLPAAPSASAPAPHALPTPSWTSTPPTPPSKDKTLAPARAATCDDAGYSSSGSSSPRSASRARPASVAVFPEYRAPVSPSMNRYDAALSSSPRRSAFASRSVSPPRASFSIPRSSSHNDMYNSRSAKRRRTAPWPLNDTGYPDSSGTHERRMKLPSVEQDEENASDDVLLPSLSRSPRNRAKMLASSSLTREESLNSTRTRRMFMLGDGDASDNEGEGSAESSAKATTSEELAVAEEVASPVDDERPPESSNAGLKRYHALLELLSTEVGYLLDLRALVSIYLEQLPSLTVPTSHLSRPSPSALSISSLGLSRPFPSSRSTFLHAAPSLSAGLGPPDVNPLASADRHRDGFDKEREERDRPARRQMFSEHDVHLVRRNARELLAWHELFVSMLERALLPFGFGWVFAPVGERRGRGPRAGNEDLALQRVDEAVEVVLGIFTREILSFEVYEHFCPGHNEAANIVRHVQDHFPVEWDAYEQRCSLLVAHTFELKPDSPRQHGTMYSSSSAHSIDSERKRRRHSMSSLSMPLVAPMSPFGVMPLTSTMAAKGDPQHKSAGDAAAANAQAMRLKFLDYLIKPVQRICRYPMLFDQLRPKHAPADAAAQLVERANAAMRAVVSKVDRASEKQAHRLRSTLIASRLIANGPASPVSPDGAAERPAQLNAEFMQSLGACLVAGALDVVYHTSSGGVRAKYLAAFLYVGGYMVLAKVPKGGKVYEPKHWFSLAGFQILDEVEDDASLPYAFHVYSSNVHLHFAAACQLEKTIWIAAIQDAQSASAPAWTSEPVPNFPPDAHAIISPNEEVFLEWSTPQPTPLPTIQSMNELETPDDPVSPAPPAPSPRKLAKTMSRADSVLLRHEHPLPNISALNRRTSTSSVKAFFSPLSFESRVSRPSSQIRHQVDHGIHDVISDSFVTVRSQARMRDEELFQLRKKPGNVSRSNSGLTLSGAFGPRKRHDSTVLPSSRRKGSLDGVPDITSDSEALGKSAALALSKRPKSSGGKRRTRQPLSVVPLAHQIGSEGDLGFVQSPESESPPAMTQSSSVASSNVNSVLPSPMEMTIPLPTPSPSDTLRYRPKRTRSLVDNVRSFFHSRSISPTPSSESPKFVVAALEGDAVEPHGGLIQWWRKGSLRRRVQSSPDAPTDESAPVTPAASSEDGAYSELTSHSSSAAPTPPSPGAPPDAPTAEPAAERRLLSRRVAFSTVAPVVRRRSLFASSRSESRALADRDRAPGPGPPLARSKTLKNLFQFQRSNSLTPLDLDPS